MRAILIDDELLALQYLERQIKKVSNLEIVETFTYIDLNKEASLIQNIDVVFLDIEMPEITGLKLAEQLLELNPQLFIVFVTAYQDYAVQAFELDALDYIIKPVQPNRLIKTIERLEQQKHSVTKSLLPKNKPLLIQVCQELTFKMNERIIPVKWRTSKAQELFLYLLHHYNKSIRKDVLSELLWPHFELDRANTQLYTSIYHIRRTIQPFKDHISIKNIQNHYILKLDNAHIDIVNWAEKMNQLPELNISTIHEYEHTMKLYSGSYLQAYPYTWIEPEQYRLEQLWIKTAYKIANFYLKHQDLDSAQFWFDQICQTRPEEELANFSLMKIYAKLGYGIFVREQFKKLQQALDELGVSMSPDISKWYKQWQNHKSPTS